MDGWGWRAPVPRQKLMEALDGMAGNAHEDVGEPCLRVDVVELCGADQGVHDRRAATAAIRADEEP